jgi:hypothetical protein
MSKKLVLWSQTIFLDKYVQGCYRVVKSPLLYWVVLLFLKCHTIVTYVNADLEIVAKKKIFFPARNLIHAVHPMTI